MNGFDQPGSAHTRRGHANAIEIKEVVKSSVAVRVQIAWHQREKKRRNIYLEDGKRKETTKIDLRSFFIIIEIYFHMN